MREVHVHPDEVAVIRLGGMTYRICIASSDEGILVTARAPDGSVMRAGGLRSQPGENGSISLELSAPLIPQLTPQALRQPKLDPVSEHLHAGGRIQASPSRGGAGPAPSDLAHPNAPPARPIGDFR